jgi:hypothetical protein
MLGSRFYWIAQLLGWISYCSLVFISVFSSDSDGIDAEFGVSMTAVFIVGIVVTHTQRMIFISLGWLNYKLPGLIPRLLISSLLSAALMTSVLLGIDFAFEYSHFSDLEASRFIVSVISSWVLILFWNAIYFTFHFFQKSRRQEVTNLELAASNKESELKNLRSQLNPHFLFNSLNSIRALVDIEPAKAKVSITTLSNLLRRSLLLGKENLVQLEDELEIAKNYLELEKVRFEERLQVEWSLDESLNNFNVPPFTLQMMVENAIKHGISNLKDGGEVRVVTMQTNDQVKVQVMNSGSLSSVSDLGVGIKNIEQRLKLQFEGRALFSLKELDGFVHAEIKFNK